MVQKITLLEREKIFELLSKKVSTSEISQYLNRHISSVYRELKRIRQPYSPFLAQLDAEAKARNSKKKYKLNKDELKNYVLKKLEEGWSPEQISGRIIIDYPDNIYMRISYETIYQFIYKIKDPAEKTRFINYLKQRKRKRYRRKRKNEKRGKIPNRVSIKFRPLEVNQRVEIGHWEGDHVVGKDHKTAIGTLVERVTRYTIIVPLINEKGALATTHGFTQAFENIPIEYRKSLTYDNGKEMTNHELFTELTKIPVYFAEPYSPWERGTNENTNGLIRYYFPKGTDFSKFKKEDFLKVQEILNNRPRKVLGFLTPKEKYDILLKEKKKIVSSLILHQAI